MYHDHICLSSQICDSLLNIGPCGNMIMGEPAFLAEEVIRITMSSTYNTKIVENVTFTSNIL